MLRGIAGLAAAAVAGIAASISSLDGDADLVPFFVGLTFLGGVEAWAVQPPFTAKPLIVAKGIVLVWLIAAVWVGVLMVAYVAASSRPSPAPEATYLGLTATVYHVLGLYGGLVLAVACAFGPPRWFGDRDG